MRATFRQHGVLRGAPPHPAHRYASFYPIFYRLFEIRHKTGWHPRDLDVVPGRESSLHTEFMLASALSEFGRNEEAALILKDQGLIENQEEARSLAMQYRKMRRYSDAIRLWRQIPVHRADDHLNYGAALAGARHDRAAIQEYRKALRLNPNYYKAWHNLANLLRQRKRLKAALGAYNRALALQPGSPAVYNCIGLTREAAGDFESAAEAYRKGLEGSPGHTDCALNLSNLISSQCGRPAAIRQLELALGQNPDSRRLHQRLSHLYRQEGQMDEAMVHSERAALSLDDSSHETRVA